MKAGVERVNQVAVIIQSVIITWLVPVASFLIKTACQFWDATKYPPSHRKYIV